MAMDPSAPRSVLVTGAAGRIGSAFCRFADTRYTLRLVDRREAGSADLDHRYLQLDLADPAACHAACANIDTVLHLAADASPTADFHDSLLDNNIKATYNIFQAAKMDLISTRRSFGYAPEDNGFEEFADHLPSLLPW